MLDAGAPHPSRHTLTDVANTNVFGVLWPHTVVVAHYGGPWCSPIACWCNKKHLQVTEPPIYRKMAGLTVLSVLNIWGVPIQSHLHTNF